MTTTNKNLSFSDTVRLIRNHVNDVATLFIEEDTTNEIMNQIVDLIPVLKEKTPVSTVGGTEGKLVADIVRNAVGTTARVVKSYMDRDISRACAADLLNRQEEILWSAWALATYPRMVPMPGIEKMPKGE